jgi:predicted AlkP superfamily pyrophosphatase or phosphodiesterase
MCFCPSSYSSSSFNKGIHPPATVMGYESWPEGLKQLQGILQDSSQRGCFHFYLDRIDSLAHHYGINSTEHLSEQRQFFLALDEFCSAIRSPASTLFMLFADHGLSPIDAENAVFLNEAIPNIERYLKRDAAGEPIHFAGSARDLYLYTTESTRTELLALLRRRLDGVADVLSIDTVIESGLFGPQPLTKRLLDRVGDTVILPYAGRCVWYNVPGRYELRYKAQHGGMSTDEMDIPFMTLEL